MSPIDTQTRIMRPTDAHLAVIAQGRVPEYEQPAVEPDGYDGRHRWSRRIPKDQIARALRQDDEKPAPVVSAPVPVVPLPPPSLMELVGEKTRRRIQGLVRGLGRHPWMR